MNDQNPSADIHPGREQNHGRDHHAGRRWSLPGTAPPPQNQRLVPQHSTPRGARQKGAVSSGSSGEKEDRKALVALYKANDPWPGRYSWQRQRWGTDEHVGLWYGVVVNHTRRVERLELGANRLRGSLPAELGRLSALQVLLLSNNHLKGPIPPELGNLRALTTLSMWNNELTGPIPGELGSLQSLKWLDLSNNKLCGPIPPQLGDLWNLEHLNLSANPLSGDEIPKSLTEHRRFRKFYLGRAMDGPPLPHVESAGHAIKILVVPVALGYLDLVSDLYTAVSYYRTNDLFWFVLVLVFALGPGVIVSTCFLRDYSFGRRFLVATQLSLLFEAVFSAASETYSPVLALVRVIEPLFESVPQLLLQLYAMLLLWSETSLSRSDLNGRIISVALSAMSLAYAATDVSSVERLLNSRLWGEGGTKRCRLCPGCPSITGLIFSRVPERGVSRLAVGGWVHPRSHVWFCFLYHVLEIISRFIPLAMVALVMRKWFFLVLPYLWLSRCLIVWAVDYSGEAMDFRFRVRFVAMPFIDSILDGTRAFGIGFALTLAESIACMVVYHLFRDDHLPMLVRLILTIMSSCCMLGKVPLALLAIFPLKANGYGSQHQGAAATRGGGAANGGSTNEREAGRRRVPALRRGEVDDDEIVAAERGIRGRAKRTSNQPKKPPNTTTASAGEDAEVTEFPPTSTRLPTAPVADCYLGTVPPGNNAAQPFPAYPAATGRSHSLGNKTPATQHPWYGAGMPSYPQGVPPHSGINTPATRHPWYGAGVPSYPQGMPPRSGNDTPATQHPWYGAGMPSYPQGVLPRGVGDAAASFQQMGSSGEGWRGYPPSAQCDTHGARQAGYASTGCWEFSRYAAAGMHAYGTGRLWHSRVQPYATTTPAASMGERSGWRRVYYGEGAAGNGGWVGGA